MPEPLTISLFAQSRLAVGRSQLRRPLPAGGRTLAEILDGLRAEYPRLARLLPSCRFLRNGEYVTARSTRFAPGDELAIHPPYSGG